jgi:hypothetical protein
MKVGVYTGSILKGAKPAKSCAYVLLQRNLTTTARTASVKTGKSQNEQMFSGMAPKDGVIGLPACG